MRIATKVEPARHNSSLPAPDPPLDSRVFERPAYPPHDAANIAETLKTVLTALILAFVFRAMFVEPFIVPTGSMANTLLGAHATLVCSNCGCEYDSGPQRGSDSESFEWPEYVICPNCQNRTDDPGESARGSKDGDRILVLKWPYDIGGFLAPRRWDVIVFRDPANPGQNYIKRLVGLPGETIEIVDGDLFIDGRIARKTRSAQQSLWFPVYDQAHLPLEDSTFGVRAEWVPDDSPNKDDEDVGWHNVNTRQIEYRSHDQAPRVLSFAPRGPHAYSQDFIAYDQGASGALAGDARLTCELICRDMAGWCDFSLRRGPFEFTARINLAGGAVLSMANLSTPERQETVLQVAKINFEKDRPARIEFAHLDYRVYVKVDGRELLASNDQQYAADLDALRRSSGAGGVQFRLTAAGAAVSIRIPRIERDEYYTYRPHVTQRAFAGNAFTLAADEYFVLGDNSPQSHDSREWFEHGPQLPEDYRLGTVRADQIVGRAFFVYLPGLMPVDEQGWWRIPDLGRVRIIR